MALRKAAGLIFLAAFMAAAPPAFAARPSVPVDLALVLAVDISFSMDSDEQALQREGYLSALTSKPVLDAIRQGRLGRIALAYVEWSGADDQRTVVNWTLIDGKASAAAFAAKLAALPLHQAARTSISGALRHGAGMFAGSGFTSARHVIDISGDGPSNEGPPVERARDEALALGVAINGLPLMLKPPTYAAAADLPLDEYYSACVIGGEGSFMLPVRDKADFSETIRTKLVTEIASAPAPAARYMPAVLKPVNCDAGGRLRDDD